MNGLSDSGITFHLAVVCRKELKFFKRLKEWKFFQERPSESLQAR